MPMIIEGSEDAFIQYKLSRRKTIVKANNGAFKESADIFTQSKSTVPVKKTKSIYEYIIKKIRNLLKKR